MKFKLLSTAAALTTLGLISTSALFAADEKPAGPPSREEMLKRFDANGDGKLDQSERQAMGKEMQNRAGGPGAGRGERAGPGGPDGPRGERGGPGGQRGERGGPGGRMADFDADGDGKISDAERTAGEAKIRAEIVNNPRAMERIDTDGDGKVSDAEWAAGRQMMGNRRGPGADQEGGPGRGQGGPGKGRGKGQPE